MTPNTSRVALIGFGEVGSLFARELIATGRHSVATYDILFDAPQGAAMRERARALKVEPCAYLKPGQFFLDINSVSPETKRGDEALIAKSGADYVEAAVMAPVAPYGIKVPMLLGGKRAAALAEILNPSGFRMTAVAETVGQASAIKMCRSVFIKGIEALAVEGFLAARRYGVEDKVIASLDETFPSLDWEKQAGYLISRVLEHGRRRAAEMRESAETVAAAGIEPLMTLATARRHDWLAARVAKTPSLKPAPQAEWRASLDAVLSRLKPVRKA